MLNDDSTNKKIEAFTEKVYKSELLGVNDLLHNLGEIDDDLYERMKIRINNSDDLE